MLIWQIFPERWVLPEGEVPFFDNFRSVPWKRLIDMGVETVYFLGIWEHKGDLYVTEEEGLDLSSNEQRVPSMMAVTNHKKIQSSLGHEENFQKLIIYLHQLGLKVIVDFVPNHTSLNHRWISEHPEYYLHNDGNLIREFSGDVAKLDYSNSQVCREMGDVLENAIKLGVDGFRVDMSHLVPSHFWKWVIPNLKKKYPDTFFMAEAYPRSLFNYIDVNRRFDDGFDSVYEKGFYDNLNRTLVEEAVIDDLTAHLKAIPSIVAGTPVTFIGNHDDPALGRTIPAEIRKQTLKTYLPAMLSILLFLTTGDKLIFNGLLRWRGDRLAHHWEERLTLEDNDLYSDIDDNVMEIFRQYAAIADNNHPKLREVFVVNGLVCGWTEDERTNKRTAVVANLSSEPRSFASDLNHHIFSNFTRNELKPGETLVWHD